MNFKMIMLYKLIALMLLFGCGSEMTNTDEVVGKSAEWFMNPDFPYNLKSPTNELKMPMVLKEISGLGYIDERGMIAAINDELGNIYVLNTETANIEEKIKFQRFGDYEAVEFIDGRYYVCNSKGDLRQITKGEEIEVELLQTRLGYENNVEGMGYDESENILYLACKDQAQLTGDDKMKGKAIYTFSLDDMRLNTTPLFVVKDNALLGWFENNVGKISKKIEDRISSFSPSAIALHPKSNLLYVTSARGDLMAVFDKAGNVRHVELVRGYMEQIEGVCFDPEGTLYVSSEGVSKKGRIFAFKPLTDN